MNISPVSFSGGAAAQSSFQDTVNRRQTYTSQDKPSAAATLKADGEKKKSPLKKLAVAAGIAAAAAVCLAAAVTKKPELFTQNPESGKLVNGVKKYAEKAGKFVADKAGAAKKFFTEKSKQSAETIKETVNEAASAASETPITETAKEVAEQAVNAAT